LAVGDTARPVADDPATLTVFPAVVSTRVVPDRPSTSPHASPPR